MITPYVKISTTGNIADGKKYDILELTNPRPYLDTPVTSGNTLSGGMYYSVGIGRTTWKFVAGLYYGDTRAGYANIDHALSIINAIAEPAITLKFQDWITGSGTTYSVYMMNRGQDGILEMVSATVDQANSFYKFSLELRAV